MKFIRKTFFDDNQNRLRTIYTGDDLLFCIYDVSRILGHTDGGSELRKSCTYIHKHRYGRKTLSFMDAGEMDALFQRDSSPEAESLLKWIHRIILPEVLKTNKEGDERNPTQANFCIENPLVLIPRLNYEGIAYAYVLLCSQLAEICGRTDSVPVRADTIELKETVQKYRKSCESLLEMNGFTWADMTDFQADRIFDRLDALTVTPEKAGYVPYDQVVEAFGKTAADFLTDWKHDNG